MVRDLSRIADCGGRAEVMSATSTINPLKNRNEQQDAILGYCAVEAQELL